MELVTTENRPQQLRGANELLLRVLRDDSSDHEIAFFCECGRPDCYAPVWLTAAAYEARLAASEPIVLSGHLLPLLPPARDLLPAA
jgi:hypothetical protein